MGIMSSPTLYQHRESGLHALHPLTKLSLIGFFLVAAATVPNLWIAMGFYCLGLIPLAIWGRVANLFIKTSLILIWPFALSLFIIQGLFTPGEEVLFALGPVSVKLAGVWLATKFTVRILIWLSSATLLMLVTRPDRLILALIELGLPRQIAYIILTTLQIIPRFQGKARIIIDAQRSRGLETEGSLIHRLRTLLPLIGPLVISSFLELDERAIALEARAFNRQGGRTSLIRLEDSALQHLLRKGLIIATVALLLYWLLRIFIL